MRRQIIFFIFCFIFAGSVYARSIAVISPNGNEEWELGSIKYITWRASGVTGNFKISLWKDDKKVENISPIQGNEIRSFRWQVGEYNGGTVNPGTGYTIKIKEIGKPVSDVSDAPFKIFEVCRLRLNSLSKNCGLTGDVFEMHGSWGSTQGTKIPCINKGRRNLLTVLSWSNTVIRVKIPAGLDPGVYKVGVYCSNEPNASGTGWEKFKIVSSAIQCAPDFELDYIEITSRSTKVGVRIKNNGEEYTGPVEFRVVGLDKLTGGSFTLDRTFTLHDFYIKESPGARILHLLDFVWPDNVCLIAFAVIIDPNNHILELNERNNNKNTTWYKNQSSSPHGSCWARITDDEIKIAKAPYGRWRPIKKYGRIILASNRANIMLPLSNCCPKAKTLDITFIFDHRNEGGEHKILHQATIKIEPGEQKTFYFSNIEFPRKKDFKRFHICINACNFYVNLKVD